MGNIGKFVCSGLTGAVCAPVLLMAVLVSNLNAQSATSAQPQFTNPILWEDLADIDILRVGDTYYYSASNMHYSPGAPILRSYDLVHWRYVGHSVPVLDFGPNYDMVGGTAYVKGTWASFLGYRKSNKNFYWGGCIDFQKTYLYTAPAVEGPWNRHTVIDKCYYDAGLLVDDDDTMYVAYGNTKFHVAQLSADATHAVKDEEVFSSPSEIGTLEGSRFYKIGGNYYIFAPHPPNGEYVLRSTTGPFGPYTAHKLVLDVPSPVAGSGAPHQGGIVQTAAGDWYYMAFVDDFPGGRIPVLAPMKWNKEGWPEMQLVDGKWGVNYPLPAGIKAAQSASADFSDSFTSVSLSPEWEWNHNPDNSKWSAGHGLTLQAATVTDDLYSARNTLTHRIPGPASSATIVMDNSKMNEGDIAGLAMLRDSSAWIGVMKEKGSYKVAVKSGLTMDRNWKTLDRGEIEQSSEIKQGKIWLRVAADIRPGAARTASFSYSTDGTTFRMLGRPFVLNDSWQFFMGYRFGIFDYATQSLGGRVAIESFRIAREAPSGM